ncbi:fatty acid hydroxylase superfamily protein [Pseudomonas putida S610]|uniref:sterol desaturase family protein n=1 Tax=Pseudomonas putida group TaxID=136845 RepID=UPI0003C58F1D|nr:sterol desaturase family protein [Pseudomonas putida]EST15002.1 fatty acid hydroxylase superfamily protein [Pseudomonas putida S610]
MRYLYAPVFFFGFIGAALAVAMNAPLFWLLPLLIGAVAVSLLCERAMPFKSRWNHSEGDTRRDVCHALVNEALTWLSVAMVVPLAALLPDTGLWPGHWPLVLQLLMAIVLADLGITLVHYASHRSAWLWRLHAVHHSVTRLYGFNGLMKHPLHQMLETLGGTLPLLMLGLPMPVAALLAFSVSVQLLLQHSNVDMRVGALRHVFAWAPVHRLHHLKYGIHGDVNFALFLPLWDRLLGTALHLPDYALRDDDVGIGDRPDYPRTYLAQLREPWKGRGVHAPAVLPAALRQALARRAQP